MQANNDRTTKWKNLYYENKKNNNIKIELVMKVFLSWSGHKSHQVALVLRDWLPSVIQSITPYVSSEDIDKGARWSSDIAKELEDSTFGILCVTNDNMEAPWLLFEAGALSKMMDKSYVCPFVFDLKRVEIKGPILQFQSTIFEKDDVKKLIQSLNKACNDSALKEDLLLKAFDVWWPRLEESLNQIKNEKEEDKIKVNEKGLKNEILEEILELTRRNHKILRTPEAILPQEYVDFLFSERIGKNTEEKEYYEEQRHMAMEMEHRFIQMREIFEMYKHENKVVDDELYMYFRRLFDLFQRQRMIRDKIEMTNRKRGLKK